MFLFEFQWTWSPQLFLELTLTESVLLLSQAPCLMRIVPKKLKTCQFYLH